MTRFAPGNLVFDLEIEKTARANHKETKLRKRQLKVVGTKSNPPPEIGASDEVASRVNRNPTQTLENKRIGVDPPEEVPYARVNINPNLAQQSIAQTIRQMAKGPIDQQPLCIAYPTMDTNFELKSELIQLLLAFCGLKNENSHKHLKEFHMTRLGNGYFIYLMDLSHPGLIFLCLGLNKFFLVSCVVKEGDCWDKKLCASCPQHGVIEQSLLQYFYNGLKPMEMNMIDAAIGGALVNMIP
ncbi:Retrotransposon gag protein [Gossypium australe]|uniref:Retrotransposon gag protein n=1 Tax=Gossypium australe TaxID=47621 RepID=A0A5B6WP21_9ROSI|nr:Retrotransposon gag protein [Gossypium australe]